MKKKTNYSIGKTLAGATRRGSCLARLLCLPLICICLLGQMTVAVKAEYDETTASIKLFLADADEESLLSGAAFCLEKEVDGTYEQIEEILVSETGYHLDHLTDGTYKLIEMQEPEGYLPLEEEWIFEISQEGVRLAQESDGIRLTTEDGTTILTIYHMRNDAENKDLRLPSTGGNSATVCFACGLILMIGTMLCLFLVRNKKIYHS